MPELVRRRNHDSQQECWHVYYRDIHVGTITAQTELPNALDRWSWSCGFYPLTHRGLKITGTSINLFQAWAAFEDAWEEYQPLCSESVLTEHRRKRVWTTWKQRMWNAGCRMPTQNEDGRSHCFCGVEVDIFDLERHVHAAHGATMKYVSEGIQADPVGRQAGSRRPIGKAKAFPEMIRRTPKI